MIENDYGQEDNYRMEQMPYISPQVPNIGLMDLRWNSNDLKWQLWKLLADVEPVFNPTTNEHELRRIHKNVPRIMNEEGAMRVINLVESYINPVVSLSNISDEDARLLVSKSLKSCFKALVLEADHYQIKSVSDLEWLRSYIVPLIFCQIFRPVKGHESKQSQTTTQEVKYDSYNESRDRGGLFSFGGKRK